jgi:hypothetical protein
MLRKGIGGWDVRPLLHGVPTFVEIRPRKWNRIRYKM